MELFGGATFGVDKGSAVDMSCLFLLRTVQIQVKLEWNHIGIVFSFICLEIHGITIHGMKKQSDTANRDYSCRLILGEIKQKQKHRGIGS